MSLSEKEIWVRYARLVFEKSDRAPCHICGRFRGLAQAHHVIPLSRQYDRGIESNEHVWLCPTHHTAVHLLIAQADGNRIVASREVIDLIGDLSRDDHLAAVLALVERAFN